MVQDSVRPGQSGEEPREPGQSPDSNGLSEAVCMDGAQPPPVGNAAGAKAPHPLAESVAVVIPWRGDCPARERGLTWVRGLYAERHPGWCVVVAEAPPGPWCKAAAVMPALTASDAEVAIVADADVWCDGLDQAVEAAAEWAPWAIPHTFVHRLSEKGTEQLLNGHEPDLRALENLAQRRYIGYPGGGIVIARRETLLEVPLDPRFTGWGQEDESWAMALSLLAGDPSRGAADLIHLYHPPQPRLSRRYGSKEGRQLARRYRRAHREGDRAAMNKLREEARDALQPSLPADQALAQR